MASAPEADARYSQAYLPDFCAAGTVLVILLVAELVAIILTLAAYEPGKFLTELAKTSMFLLWLALSEMWLLREPWIVLPKRIFQSVALTLFALGAALPSRRMATVLGAIALPLVILALATVRAKLA